MARIIPELSEALLEQVQSPAERKVYRSLRDSLPSDVLVVHSLDLILRAPGRPVRDAEADFIVFDPRRGVLAIEVKGGGISFDDVSRQWWTINGEGVRNEIKDPLHQAMLCKHQVLQHLKNSHLWGFGGMPRVVLGHAALFPDIRNLRALVGPGRDWEILGGVDAMDDLDRWVTNVLAFWQANDHRAKQLGALGMTVCDSVFCRSATVSVPLSLSIDHEHRRFIELTNRQANILRSLKYRNRATISGGAGTGKTLLALQHAKTLAAQGLRTLLVCYNRPLAEFLKQEAFGHSNLDVMTFHQLCDWRIKVVRAETGRDLREEARQKYPAKDIYDVQEPFALAQSTDLSPLRYQAILVDEAQDFGDEYWFPIELLLEDEETTPLYAFQDRNQALYRTSETFPIQEAPLLLTENCRNTKHIHNTAYRFYEGDTVDANDVDGVPIAVIECEGLKQQAKKLKRLVSDLISQEDVKPVEIAVLVFGNRPQSYFDVLLETGQPTSSRWSIREEWNPGDVLVDTVRRFKGLEASLIVLWGLGEVRPMVDDELLYVGLSRARSRVFVVGSSDEVAASIGLISP